MTRIYKVPFATTSDKRETLATTEQPDGKVSLTTGWTSVYELENDNPSYKPVGRGEMNGILGEITEGIGELQLQGGVIRWRSIDGGFNKGAIVYGADMQTMWQSTIDSNTTDPDSAGASGWDKLGDFDIATTADITAGTIGKLLDAAGLKGNIATTADITAGTTGKLVDAAGLLNSVVFKKQITENRSDSGFIRFPGGLLIQWGVGRYLASSGANGTAGGFVTPFSSNCFLMVSSDTGSGTFVTSVAPIDRSTFRCWGKSTSGSFADTILSWVAIGV